MILKAENIDINSLKNEETSKKKFLKLEKEYRDYIKSKWRQVWDMNKTL